LEEGPKSPKVDFSLVRFWISYLDTY